MQLPMQKVVYGSVSATLGPSLQYQAQVQFASYRGYGDMELCRVYVYMHCIGVTGEIKGSRIVPQ